MKKTVFAVVLTVVVIALCFTVSAFIRSDDIFDAENGTYNGFFYDFKINDKTESGSSPAVDFDYSSSEYAVSRSDYYNYRSLTEVQKGMYNKIYDATVIMQVGNIELGEGTKRDAAVALYAVKYDNPHLFWIGYEYGIGVTDDNEVFIRFDEGGGDSKYLFSHDERVKMMKELDTAVKQIFARCITDDMSDYDKELAIHDWLCENVKYNQTAGDIATTDERQGAEQTAWTSYGAIVEKSAVCEGYSKAFQMLMYYAGINSNIICGETSDRAAHMWNTAYIDGNWYNVDVLWDDIETSKYGPSHAFFNVTSDFIGKTHEIYPNSSSVKDDKLIFSAKYNLNLPTCNLTDKNFYVVNQTAIYSDEQYKTVVSNALKKAAENDIDTVEFFYTYKDINENVVSYDIKNNNIFSAAKEYYKDIKGIRYEADSHGSFKINISR